MYSSSSELQWTQHSDSTCLKMGIFGGSLLWVALSLASSPKGLRVNRALRATHSRRQVNGLIETGRLSVNDVTVESPDDRLKAGDKVKLDGALQAWEEADLPPHRYVKYHKPGGVVTTTDRRVKGNIIAAFEQAEARGRNDASSINENITSTGITNQRRVYPIGRLDAESVGLILLTSDGSIVNPLLRTSANKTKEYRVRTSPTATDSNIRDLRNGVVITTLARRDGVDGVPVTARTLPCIVEKIIERQYDIVDDDGEYDLMALRFVIKEGRNRQIRKMCAELGLLVTSLDRRKFAGITLKGCEDPGSWMEMSDQELISIGAKNSPTRDELRTPDERARRKLKKLNKKRKRTRGY